MPFLIVLGLVGGMSALTLRVVDPMVPLLSTAFGVDIHTIALLASAFALPYALGQPFLGPVGDAKGKERVILLCMGVVGLTLIISAFSTNYSILLICRILSGLAAGGVIPLSLATIGDRFPIEQRQIAISRYMIAIVTGQILGAPMSGLVSDIFGWRAVFFVSAALVIAVTVMFGLSMRQGNIAEQKPLNIAAAVDNYRDILANPKAVICYSTVFIEGICVFGMFPFIAAHLQENGSGGVREAGFVIGGLGLGGGLFSLFAPRLLRKFGRRDVMGGGGVLLLVAFIFEGFSTSWPSQMAAFAVMGFAFYMLHSALQTEATELSPTARGSAVALHAFFFFIGQALGPFIYGTGLPMLGIPVMTILAGLMICAAGLASRALLNRADRRLATLQQVGVDQM